ncbi:hypothetical protein LEP3755_62700 (plasmid) [Leptolyngbya sp. NIES-3755]|nr:hypothetical protein LEP3755_62700 [Leptolyngbya sp. NIES-3755]
MTEITSNSLSSLAHQRLMELVEAEDAASGEVGCGRDWGSKLPVYLQTCQINLSEDAFRELLSEHLGEHLEERDFDRIIGAVRFFIESIVVNAHLQLESSQRCNGATVPQHIPTLQLRKRFEQDLGEVCSTQQIEQIVQFAHQTIHAAVLHPRSTWLPPIWVLTDEQSYYVVQAACIEDAIAQVSQQHPEHAKMLRVIQANNIIATGQVMKIDSLP